MRLSQFVLTMQRDAGSILKHIFSFHLPTIKSFVRRLHHRSRLAVFLAQHLGPRYNVLLFDFVAQYPELLNLIVASNSPVPLRLHAGFLGSRDFTAQLARQVAATQVLFIPSVTKLCKSLGIPPSPLTLIYSFGDSPLQVVQSVPGQKRFLVFRNPLQIRRDKELEKSVLLLFYQDSVRAEYFTGPEGFIKARKERKKSKGNLLYALFVQRNNMFVF